MSASRSLIAYCRPGFESECAQELAARDAALVTCGFARSMRDSGLVEFVLPDAESADRFCAGLDWRQLTFARQFLRVIAHVTDLPRQDRLSALMPAIRAAKHRYADAWIEAPDSDAARELAPLCRSLNSALVTAMKKEKLLDPGAIWRLHVCLADNATAFIAEAKVSHSSPWPGGIPRLRFPRGAPSRSTLKLEEAFLTLLDDEERDRWLKSGMSAVDLGASPGGWTWQLANRSIRVAAVDNGPMDAVLLSGGLVTHVREDGFHYRPQSTVDWMVCDMVEQPRRVAARMGQWLASGWCRYAMFNLKLPMKKRFEELNLCREVITEAVAATGRGVELRSRHLYHDREEVTVFARVVPGSQ